MTANINPDSGIAYGYISARALEPDIVDDLQTSGTDVDYEENWKEFVERTKQDWLQAGGTEEDFKPEAHRDRFNDSYQPDEPVHEGTKDGVKYRTSWLGGALNVWIFESPHVTDKAGRASPCVPNAGILDTLDGDVRAYNVPDEWRRKEE